MARLGKIAFEETGSVSGLVFLETHFIVLAQQRPSHQAVISLLDVDMTLSRTKSKQRDPPPSLFLHPSPGASHVSLPGILAPGSAIPGPASIRRERSSYDSNASIRHAPATTADQQGTRRALKTAESGRTADRTDALWAEMQATLEEVELSASAGTHVFGRSHDVKLAELRAAQIALAQAWTRSEVDGSMEKTSREDGTPDVGGDLRSAKGSFADGTKPGTGDAEPNKVNANASAPRPFGEGADVERLGSKLEEETEADILLARKRREANDAYFQRVNAGVIDVVSKLEKVAVAMRAVEQESMDVWNENENVGGGDEPVLIGKTKLRRRVWYGGGLACWVDAMSLAKFLHHCERISRISTAVQERDQASNTASQSDAYLINMKFFPQIVAALALLPGALAVDRKVSVIVSFDDPNTPDSVVAEARKKIIEGGGQITHDYQIIKGFSAIAPEKSLEMVQTFGSEHSIRVEEDQVVTANSN
ncbi:hypothetical protein NLG97_g1009 [Lecanicillium saksenae]|uniref:Uncharacterized protein n=1 Tax=Lecanicillium saksenae TaxID=468837 RepID=A0ACC1R7L8_9HYPO|nr:hypothetical protein NLG97_g1009 [Lecanicillium saksenae]